MTSRAGKLVAAKIDLPILAHYHQATYTEGAEAVAAKQTKDEVAALVNYNIQIPGDEKSNCIFKKYHYSSPPKSF